MGEKNRSFIATLKSIGPAIVVASVVLGPGSILLNSKMGATFGYSMIWVLVWVSILMTAMTALAARLGAVLESPPCSELSNRKLKPVAILVGISLFIVAAGFQFSNNIGLLFAVEPFLETHEANSDAALMQKKIQLGALIGVNIIVIVALLAFRNLYRHIETVMKVLVGIMIVAFAINLFVAQPDWGKVLSGLIPRWNELANIDSNFIIVAGVIGTTFSVAGAFYQAYLVKQKGWTADDVKASFVDSVAGIAALCLMSLMIMITAAAVLHGNEEIDVKKLNSAAVVAQQLKPTFGFAATVLFCVGIFAGAVSSFLVNALIGGTVLSDALGLGSKIESTGVRVCTVFALLVGLAVAIAIETNEDFPKGQLITFAQAFTVIANPMMAAALVWLAFRPDLKDARRIPIWLKGASIVALIVATILSVRMATIVYASVAGSSS